MTWFFVILAIAVITFIFLAVLGPLGELPPAEPDRRPDEVAGEPVFDVVVRGYRMDEVDERISSLQAEIDELQAALGRPAAPARSEQVNPEQVDSGQVHPEQLDSEQVRAEQVRAEQVRAEQ